MFFRGSDESPVFVAAIRWGPVFLCPDLNARTNRVGSRPPFAAANPTQRWGAGREREGRPGQNSSPWTREPASGQRRNPTRGKAARPEDRRPRTPNPTLSKASEVFAGAEQDREKRRSGIRRGAGPMPLEDEAPCRPDKGATIARMADSILGSFGILDSTGPVNGGSEQRVANQLLPIRAGGFVVQVRERSAGDRP